jgi:HEXXH motif-containing protein
VTTIGLAPNERQLRSLLQGGNTAPTNKVLIGVRRTRNLLLLRGLLDLAEAAAAQEARVARLGDNFAMLAEIESIDPRRCAPLLAHPYVGAWLATCLRHFSRLPRDGRPGRPLWADLGSLGGIVIAAAMATGVEADVSAAAHDGQVFIPTLGRLLSDGEPSWKMTTVKHLGGDALRVADSVQIIELGCALDRSEKVQPLHQLSASCDGLTLNLELDDLSSYVDLYPIATSERLTDESVADWQRKLADAWDILVTRHRPTAEAIALGLQTLVPLRSRTRSEASSTSRHAPGALALTTPRNGTSFAATLVHEFQHTKLFLLMEIFGPVNLARARLHYSPWRDDPRPLAGLLHGLYAGAALADFWRIEAKSRGGGTAAAFHSALARRQVQIAMAGLTNADARTGGQLLAAICDIATMSQDVPLPVPLKLARMSDDLTLDHAVRWRLRHYLPASSDIELLAGSWLAGKPPTSPLEPAISPGDAAAFAENYRLRLAYTMLLSKDDARVRDQQQAGRELDEISGVTSADRLLLRPDYAAASASFETEIAAGMRPVEAWAGLAVALRGQAEPAAMPLIVRPDLIRAIYEKVASSGEAARPSPIEFARWMVPAVAAWGPNPLSG